MYLKFLYVFKENLLTVIEWLMVRGSQVALKHVIHDMETKTLAFKLKLLKLFYKLLCDLLPTYFNTYRDVLM